eukprot:8831190-Pyramimonas_sp.AAC.1
MLYCPVARGAGMKLSGLQVPMTVATDSKGGHDRLNSDAGAGSSAQKSVNLELASNREILDRPQTMARWKDGSNMFVERRADEGYASGPSQRDAGARRMEY